MKKLFFLSLLALTFVATGCSKDGETTYSIPTESSTNVDTAGGTVERTQAVKGRAVVVTYYFDGTTYNHQEWVVYFETQSGAFAAYATYAGYYTLKNPTVTVTNNGNKVLINYPNGTGLGDEKLSAVTSLDAVSTIVEGLDLLNLLNGLGKSE